jgi:outer membrane protein insertion porin family
MDWGQGNASGESMRFQSPDPHQHAEFPASRQETERRPVQSSSTQANTNQANPSDVVSEVIIKGNKIVSEHHLLRNIRTRPGRYFDPDLLQQDVDQLWRMKELKRINGPYIERTDEGIVVTIEVVEKQLISTVEFVGNRGLSDRALKKHTGLIDGQPLDVYEVRMLKTRIEDFYREKGFPKTQVEILDGDQPTDEKIVFLIHEDQKQRIWAVAFEGNSAASGERLKVFIKSKPGILKVFGGLVKRDEIDQDITRLMTYYRSLGYFNARIGREITESNDGRWLTLRFIIDEGPRYKVRNVAFIGNTKFSSDQLNEAVDLKPDGNSSPEFNSAKMNQDVVTLRDLYGSQGYVFSQIDAEPRFLETPGLLDLVYKIDEGKQYRVGMINVHIDGDYGVTRREVVLNRLGMTPGDIIDSRKMREAERRLNSAQIFAGGDPSMPGAPPRIVVRPPELRELERMANADDDGLNR